MKYRGGGYLNNVFTRFTFSDKSRCTITHRYDVTYLKRKEKTNNLVTEHIYLKLKKIFLKTKCKWRNNSES